MTSDMVTVTDKVIHTVARETQTDPIDLPPLYDVVDGDSLHAVVEQMDEGTVMFGYAGVTVTVSATGTVQVASASRCPEPDDSEPTATGD